MTGWLAAFSATAVAHDPPAAAPNEARKPSRLTAYFYGKEQIAALYEAGRTWDRKLGLQQDCKGAYNIQPLNLFLLKAIDFPEGKAHPVAGSWQHRYVFERCGKRMTYNAVFVARANGKPEALEHVPGNTNASLPQISEALQSALPAARQRLLERVKGCAEAELIDTRLAHPPREPGNPDQPAGHWEESWTFRGCGKSVELSIVFFPDGKGDVRSEIKSLKQAGRPVP